MVKGGGARVLLIRVESTGPISIPVYYNDQGPVAVPYVTFPTGHPDFARRFW